MTEPRPEMEMVDLRNYFKILHKWRWVLVLVTVVAVSTSGVLSFFVLPPVYSTKVTLMVANAAAETRQFYREADGLQGVLDPLSRLPQMTINSYANQVQSPAVLDKVIKAMKLDPQQYTVAGLDAMTAVKAIKDTNLIEVTITNTDPEFAANLANTLSREYLDFISEKNQEQMAKSVSFLETQFKTVDEDLKKNRGALTAFQSQPRGVAYLEQELATKSSDANRYQSELLQAQVQVELLKAGITRLQASLANAPQTIETIAATFESPAKAELNPVWVSLTQSLDDKSVALAEKEAQAQALSSQVTALQADLKKLQVEITEKRAEQTRLQAEVDRQSRTRDLLSDKITETRIARSVNLGETNVLIVSPAMVPSSPVKPNKNMNIAIAGVLGIMVSVGLAFLLEYLDNTVKTPEEVQRHLGAPVLGSIPFMSASDLQKKPATQESN